MSDQERLMFIRKEMKKLISFKNSRRVIKVKPFENLFRDLDNHLQRKGKVTEEDDEDDDIWSNNLHVNCFRCNKDIYVKCFSSLEGKQFFCDDGCKEKNAYELRMKLFYDHN